MQDEYRDTQTLKKRLQALAIAMGLRAQQQKQKADDGTSLGSDAPETAPQAITDGISPALASGVADSSAVHAAPYKLYQV